MKKNIGWNLPLHRMILDQVHPEKIENRAIWESAFLWAFTLVPLHPSRPGKPEEKSLGLISVKYFLFRDHLPSGPYNRNKRSE